jgi:hypothetical protein
MFVPGYCFIHAVLKAAIPSCLAIGLCVSPATAQSKDSNLLFLVASSFLCDPADSSSCPATAKSNQGDSYEMSGAGTLDVQGKSAKGAGTYTHRSPSGNMLETGVWIASELLSFDSYGVSPPALPRQNPAFGPEPLGLKGLPMHAGPTPTGGLAILRIRLWPLRGPSRSAVLQVNCTLGDVPRERSVEGIRLAFEGSTNDFTEEAGGRVMFLSTARPEVTTPSKVPGEEDTPETSEPRQN